jgi:hypothetical protein
MSSDYEKGGIHYDDVVRDADILGGKDVTPEDARRHAELSEEELAVEKKLVKKMDLIIMPLVVTVYLLNYIDRNNYPAARLQGLQDELAMSDEQYQLGLSILFVGYVSIVEQQKGRLAKANITIGIDASAFQRFAQLLREAILVPWILRHCMGLSLSTYVLGQQLPRDRSMSLHSRSRGSAVLPGCALLFVEMVHQERAQPANVHFLFGFPHLGCFRFSDRGRHFGRS